MPPERPITNAVRQAASPQEALLVIATALDHITTQLAAAADSPWGEWTDPPVEPPATRWRDQPAVMIHAVAQQHAVEEIKAELAETTDGEDRLALEAQLRIAQDAGKAQVQDEGRRSTVTDEGDTADVNIPPPTPARKDAREVWAIQVALWEFISGLTRRDAIAAYATGGPEWLYAYDRDAVVNMPLDWRRDLINDLAIDSQAAAHEMSRDILKADFNDVIAGGTAIAEDNS